MADRIALETLLASMDRYSAWMEDVARHLEHEASYARQVRAALDEALKHTREVLAEDSAALSAAAVDGESDR